MERVVYLLGAGFSAPLGLPVMSNFLIKSKDMYQENPDHYKHFKQVFDRIKDMSVCKNYYETDLFNIEEILSILEMGEYLEGKKLKKSFLRYIADVIERYTPALEPYELNRNWSDFVFGKYPSGSIERLTELWNGYGFFIGNIHNLFFSVKKIKNEDAPGRRFTRRLVCRRNPNPEITYSVITLNYDLIPENICHFINVNYDVDEDISFVPKPDGKINGGQNGPVLAKLHGSVDATIIPPTWNKSVDEKISDVWRLAHEALVDANHIRIIGYSLPIADTYVKYLLKTAAIDALPLNLKSIDVICRDPDESVRDRYRKLVRFRDWRFVDADVEDYLSMNLQKYSTSQDIQELRLDMLEEAHKEFMRENGKICN